MTLVRNGFMCLFMLSLPLWAGGPLSLSGPHRHENLEIYLILHQNPNAPGEYQPLSQAMAAKTLVVHETGKVNQLAVENRSDKAVFIQAGDIVKGGKQDRVLATDLIVPPRSGKLSIQSFCVESGRWRKRAGEKVTSFSKSEKRISGKGLRKSVRKKNAQSEVWDNVAQELGKLSKNLSEDVTRNASSSSYQLGVENKKLKTVSKEYMKSFKALLKTNPRAVGFAYAVNGSFSGGDLYHSHELFKKLWPKLLDAVVTEAVAESDQERKTIDPGWPMALLRGASYRLVEEEKLSTHTYRKVKQTKDITQYTTSEKREGNYVHVSWEESE